MKILIESGTTIDEALNNLKTFFSDQCSGYSCIKSNMHIYVDLKNNKGQICPENEKEFTFSGDKVIDILAKEKQDTFLRLVGRLEHELQWLEIQLKKEERNIIRDKKYLETAEEKQRKKERIESRKVALQEHLEQYSYLQDRINTYITVLDEIKKGCFRCEISVKTEKKRGRNNREYEMTLFGQSEDFKWCCSNIYGLII